MCVCCVYEALSSIDESTCTTDKKKFEIAYFITKEKLALAKMSSLCELEQHGVDLGQGYKNDHSCADFISYIAHNLKRRAL